MEKNKKNLQICLLGSSFNQTGNMGLNILTAGVIRSIYEAFPDACVYCMDYGKKEETYDMMVGDVRIAVKHYNIRFSKKIYLKNNVAILTSLALLGRVIPIRSIGSKIIERNKWLKLLASSDVICVISGGDSFSDIYGLERFIYVSIPQIVGLLLGRRLMLLPQTVGPFRRWTSKVIARYILTKAWRVYSRDQDSLKYIRSIVKDGEMTSKMRFSYDLGFVVDGIKPPGDDYNRIIGLKGRSNGVVGFNISGLLYVGGYTRDNMFGLRIDYKRFVNELIAFLIERRGFGVVLVPHFFKYSDSLESDSRICQEVYNESKNKYGDKILMIENDVNQFEIKYIIGMCDFFIGSRMHACIAALSQCVPAIAVAYSRKFVGVIRSLRIEELVIDPRMENEEGMIKFIDKSIGEREVIKNRLEKCMPMVKRRALDLFKEVKEELIRN